MEHYIGVITLEKPLYCTREVSGKSFKTKIADMDILVIFPSIPDDYNPEKVDLVHGDLCVQGNFFKGKINWGMVHSWPTGIFSVNAVLCYFYGYENDVRRVYEKFPHWKEKLNKIFLIHSGNYIIPEQKIPALIRGGGVHDGIQIFNISDNSTNQYINNYRTIPIKLHLATTEESVTSNMLKKIFAYAGSEKEIELAYELLVAAYQAEERLDFRSAVILGGSAVEKAILNRMRKQYPSNRKFNKKEYSYKMLGGRFKWLEYENIHIPVSDYKTTIIDIRNDAAHKGKLPSHDETKLCLKNCKILIEEYAPNILEP